MRANLVMDIVPRYLILTPRCGRGTDSKYQPSVEGPPQELQHLLSFARIRETCPAIHAAIILAWIWMFPALNTRSKTVIYDDGSISCKYRMEAK